jgi:hypothetical protein
MLIVFNLFKDIYEVICFTIDYNHVLLPLGEDLRCSSFFASFAYYLLVTVIRCLISNTLLAYIYSLIRDPTEKVLGHYKEY